jgi:hypothetical protein
MSPQFFIVLGSLALICAYGCGSGQPELTKAREDELRHPTADPNWKGPNADAQSKMAQQIEAFRNRHKNDKVEFKTGG